MHAPSPAKRSTSPVTSASTPTATWWSRSCDGEPSHAFLIRRAWPGATDNAFVSTPMPHKIEVSSATMTPREIVQELDRHIVGQHDAKRAVAIALRNRWRRMQLQPELRNEVMPKNILMIGPTGVGKTEIARRLATLANAPFVKVEATRFTEVGYVGKDVEQIIRDLADTAVKLYREQAKVRVRTQAEER